LKGNYIVKSYSCSPSESSPSFFRYLRLIQTGKNPDNYDYLMIGNLELFGSVRLHWFPLLLPKSFFIFRFLIDMSLLHQFDERILTASSLQLERPELVWIEFNSIWMLLVLKSIDKFDSMNGSSEIPHTVDRSILG
jgi:hypothetical protein